MSEFTEQRELIKWARLRQATEPRLALLYSIPNGGHRSKASAGKAKAEGCLRGIPDLCIPVRANGWNALYIEMKAKKGRVAPEQVIIHDMLRRENNCVQICRSWHEAARVLEYYLGCEKTV